MNSVEIKTVIKSERERREHKDVGGSILEWALKHFGVDGPRDRLDEDQKRIRHLCHKFATGRGEAPEGLCYAAKLRAYPCASVPEWVEKQKAACLAVWNAVALHFQHELKIIRMQYAGIAEQLEKETITEAQAKQLRKEVSFEKINQLRTSLPDVFDQAIEIRKSSAKRDCAAHSGVQRTDCLHAGEVFVQWVAGQLPVEQLRTLKVRFQKTLRVRQGKAWDKGYPQHRESGDWSIVLHFSGNNLEMGKWHPGTEAENGYLSIGQQYDPAGHHGRRQGLKRAARQMRRFTIYVPGDGKIHRDRDKSLNNSFPLDVLIHNPNLPSRVKQVTIRSEGAEWYAVLVVEEPVTQLKKLKIKRNFLGIDVGWRRDKPYVINTVCYARAGEPSVTRSIVCSPNRRSRRQMLTDASATDRRGTTATQLERVLAQFRERPFAFGMSLTESIPDMDFSMPSYLSTQDGIRGFIRRISDQKDHMKAIITSHLQKAKTPLPAGWGTAGKTGMAKVIATIKTKKLKAQFIQWQEWDRNALALYGRLFRDVTNRIEAQYRQVSQEICGIATDIGIEQLNVKRLAESDSKAQTAEEKKIDAASRRNRQMAAPAKFLSILKWTAQKRGVRVHLLDPWMTTRRCYHCGADNEATTELMLVCVGCRRKLNQDENAAHNLARLARECSGGDTDPKTCSHDGKQTPFHKLPDKRQIAAD